MHALTFVPTLFFDTTWLETPKLSSPILYRSDTWSTHRDLILIWDAKTARAYAILVLG